MVTPEFLAPFFLMLLIPALTALYVWRTENRSQSAAYEPTGEPCHAQPVVQRSNGG